MAGASDVASLESDFRRARELWDEKDFRGALTIFVHLAECGHTGAMLNIGYFYDLGLGVKRDSTKALRWYRRAYRRGDSSAANNIGTVYRDRGNLRRAAEWFTRAIQAGEIGSALELAKIHLARSDGTQARRLLRRVVTSDSVTESDIETAKTMLAKLDRA